MSEQYFDGATVFCNNCNRYAKSGGLRGSGFITFVLILCAAVPGVIYMIWRRSGPKVCTTCKQTSVIPISQRINQLTNVTHPAQAARIEVECPACAETILAKAVKCKHCGTDVTPTTATPIAQGEIKVEPVMKTKEETESNPSRWLYDLLNPKR